MNFIEEINKFELIKDSDAYEMAKLEVLLRLDRIYIGTREGHIAVFPSNLNRDKSIYVYTNRELIPSDDNNYEEFSISKFITVLKNRDANFNDCLVNNNTEYKIKLAGNIPYFIKRYTQINSPNTSFIVSLDDEKNSEIPEIGDRAYIVAKDALDENNIDILIRSSGEDRYIYIYTEPSLAKNNIYKEQLMPSKLVGINREKLNTIMTNLSNNGVSKVIVNFGTPKGVIFDIIELINKTL